MQKKLEERKKREQLKLTQHYEIQYPANMIKERLLRVMATFESERLTDERRPRGYS